MQINLIVLGGNISTELVFAIVIIALAVILFGTVLLVRARSGGEVKSSRVHRESRLRIATISGNGVRTDL
jgi:hypothetical protein